MLYAQIKNGKVTNIIKLNDSNLVNIFTTNFDYCIRIDQLNPIPNINWLYDGNTFSNSYLIPTKTEILVSKNILFNNLTNGFSAIESQTAIEEAVSNSAIGLSLFGDGSDGDVSLNSGTTTLARTMFYNNLTLNSTAIVNPNGFKIYVKGALSLNTTSSIKFNGFNGNNASTTTGGSAVGGPTGVETGSGGTGGTGGSGNGASSNGQPGNSPSTIVGLGGNGGAGGNGGNTSVGSGGIATSGGVVTLRPERTISGDFHASSAAFKGGGAGGAGGAAGGSGLLANGGGGGSGGTGGGIIIIFCKSFNNTSSVGITANGGNGGNGDIGTGTNRGGGGGAGSGGGGYIHLITQKVIALGTLTVTGGTGGTGGAGGGTGVAGASGSSGSIGHYSVYEIGTQTWTTT